MSERAGTRCDTFVMVDVPTTGLFRIQWQLPSFTYTCIARSLEFAPLVLAFVTETRGNPAYRDLSLGGGVYRYMPEKALDLSRFFVDMRVKLEKLGEEDDSYQLIVEHAGGAWLKLRLLGEETDIFVDSMVQIAEEALCARGQ